MKIIKGAAALSIAAVLAFAVTGCGGGAAPQAGGGQEEAVSGIEQLANVSGAAVHLDENTTQATVEVEIAEGEALVIMADFGEEMTDEITVTSYKDGEEYTTDYFYGGYGYSETGADPGTYKVEIDGAGATGTMWVLAYPAGQVDVMSMDAEDIVNQVLSDIS